ncbi:cation:proton antiporter domain-containing protein [Paracoccus seriniphilus]|uniref:cation:proton antiporter domain-containing protein n=1 Tax=Paracoccus seriniphilus TaxID=184748 RepID=UPI0035695906
MDNFLLLSTVYLITMVVAVPISARLGLGSVLGYLICGILIGPVLHLTGNKTADLQHFAEFGVVMMLFLIGLELEPRSLWNMRHKLIGLGVAQVSISVAVIATLAAFIFDLGWSSSLALGMILSLSSTAIVLQTLSEKGLMQTAGGRSAFSVLLTQDIAVIPMIALMPLLAPYSGSMGESHGEDHIGEVFMAQLPGWGVTLVTLGAVAVVIVLGQYLIRPVFRLVVSSHLPEMETAMALLIVVGIASLMILVGLSPALGTFLAGVTLASSELRHELQSQIEPFKGLLLGLFFVTVGEGMNFTILAQNPVPILSATAGLIAVKALILWLIGRSSHMRHKDRSLFTLSLAQAGEFGFVLVSFAVSLAILPTELAQSVLLVIALTMLCTPLLFILHAQVTRRLAEAGVTEPPDDITEQQPIIIAGVGRFGQVVNRLVTMSGFQTTVLDHDLKLIQLMRRFGFKGYFGDPTRPEILLAAGLDKASILVAALDNPAANLKLIHFARERRPDLHIIARARDRVNVYELYSSGANDIVRETFDSSLRAGRYVLENAGLSEYEASELERIFYRLDRASLRELAQVWKPGVPLDQNAEYVQLSRELNRNLENALMERFDRAQQAPAAKERDEPEEPEHGLAHELRQNRPGGRSRSRER